MRHEVGLRQRRVVARARRFVVHEVGDAGRMPRQQQDAVGEVDRFLEVVRHQHGRGAGLHEDALQLLAHEQRHLVVERRERLVEKQDLRLHHERAHDRDELLLAAGEQVRIFGQIDLDAEMGDQPLHPRAALRLRHAHQLERILDVLERAQPGEQRLAVVLEHVAELDLAQRLAVEQDFAGIGRDQPGDHVDERALAAAVRVRTPTPACRAGCRDRNRGRSRRRRSRLHRPRTVTWAGRRTGRLAHPTLISAAGVSTCEPRGADLRTSACIWSRPPSPATSPICTEKSTNF